MLEKYEPLLSLPFDFQLNWMAELRLVNAIHQNGSFRLVNVRRTEPKTFEELKIIVLVVDENGFPIPNVKVAFSYSTANPYQVGDDFTWVPPSPHRADIFPTTGAGQIEHVQGGVVKQGQPGGITVYILHPEFSSDYVTGCVALADHTGMHLTFQLQREGVVSISDQLALLEQRVKQIEFIQRTS
ncbi:MAG: hypothetical protein AAF485_28495 [Chloroflexota bacterium]